MREDQVLLLPATTIAPRLARQHLAGVGAGWSTDLRELALLLTSELVTNAVRYGGGVISLTVEKIGARVRITVGDGNPALPRISAVDHTADRGRGLHLLESLATRWGCVPSTEPRGKRVWFELAAD
jgi:anti-sigma regulatory factor (Ser/Thr protein kinase)